MNTIYTLPKKDQHNKILDFEDSEPRSEQAINEEKRQKAILASAVERREYVRNIIIPIPQYKIGIELLESYYNLSGQPDPGGVCIYGESGLGKTYIASTFMKNHSSTITQDDVTIPILFVTIEASMAAGDLLKYLLKELGDPFTSSLSIADLNDRLLDALKHRKVKFIIIDEAQAFGEGNGHVRSTLIGNTLKRLHDKSCIPQAYLGVQKDLMRFFNLAEQLSERITSEYTLHPLENTEEFRGLLHGYDSALPMQEPASLASEYADQIHLATNGNLRRIRRLLANAIYLSAIDNAPSINNHYLSKSFFHVFGSTKNPFL